MSNGFCSCLQCGSYIIPCRCPELLWKNDPLSTTVSTPCFFPPPSHPKKWKRVRPDQNRPEWDDYLSTLALVVSSRSLDPDTKHGCVIVDEEHTILSTGYNSPPRGSNDTIIPLSRPQKYLYFSHAEEAAVANAARNGVALKGSTAYITGHPCTPCLRMLLNSGVKEIVVGGIGSACVSPDVENAAKILLQGRKDIVFRHYVIDNLDILDATKTYYFSKVVLR